MVLIGLFYYSSMLIIDVEVSRRESPALVRDATSDLLILILGSPGNLFLSLGFETQVTVKKKAGLWLWEPSAQPPSCLFMSA